MPVITRRVKPIYFRPSRPVGSPEKALRARRLTEFAKKVIQGKENIDAKKRKRGKPFQTIPREKEEKIIALLLGNPLDSNLKIGKAAGVRPGTVEARRQMLQEKGVIRGVTKREKFKQVQRNPARKTSYLNAEQRTGILRENLGKIKRKAIHLYNLNRRAFDFRNMTLEDIADDLTDRLDWQLQTYHPRMMPKPEETKLERFFNKRLRRIGAELKRTAWKSYRKIASLEQLAKPIESMPEIKEITVEDVEEVIPKLNLNIVEKAVLFALAANMPSKMIAKETGYSSATVSNIKAELEKRLRQLVHAQKYGRILSRG